MVWISLCSAEIVKKNWNVCINIIASKLSQFERYKSVYLFINKL